MASVLAIVSKALFEAERGPAGTLRVGDTWPTAAYTSANKGLAPLAEGGDLYLVTVRPGDRLWLVAVLRAPRFDGKKWCASPNTEPIRDLSAEIPALRFASGKGLQVKPGALGMSLQTPRALAPTDLTVLGTWASPPPPLPEPPPPPKAKVAPKAASPADASDAADALAEAIARWRETPWAELVPAAVALSAAAESPEARALRVGEGPVDDARWDAVLARGRPEDLGAVLDTFHRAPLQSLLSRAGALADLEPDPRLAHLLHRMLRVPPFRATSSQPVWNAVFDAALRHPDPATLAVVREIAAIPFPSGAAFQKYMANKLAAAEKRLVGAGVEAVRAPPDHALRWGAYVRAAAPPTATPPAPRAVPPPSLPTCGAPGSPRTVDGASVRFLRTSPTAAWVAAWVADPSEREGQTNLETAAFVPIALDPPRALPPVPLRGSECHIHAVGHRLGRLVAARGAELWLIEPEGRRRLCTWAGDAAPDDELRSPWIGLAFGPDDRFVFGAVDCGDAGTAWVEVDVASGAITERWRGALSGDNQRNGWRSPSTWVVRDGDRTLWVRAGGRQLCVFDPRWGAFAQWIEAPAWSAPISSDGQAVGWDSQNKSWTRVDSRTGVTTSFPDDAPADLRGDEALTARATRAGPAGPLVRRGPDGAVRQRVARDADDTGPAALFSGGVWVGSDARVTAHPASGPPTTIGWSAARADAVASRAGTVAVVAGSRVGLFRGSTARTHTDEHLCRGVALSPDGLTAYVGATKSIRVFDLGRARSKPRTLAGHAYPVTAVAVAVDGTVASASEDHLVILWDPAGTVRHKLAGHPEAVRGVAFAPDGAAVASVGADGVIRVHDVATGALTRSVPAPDATGAVAWAADGVHLAWLTPGGVALDGGRTLALPGATALAAHPDRALFAVATADGTVHGLLPDGAHRPLARGFVPSPIALAFDGDSLVVGASLDAGAATTFVPLSWET